AVPNGVVNKFAAVLGDIFHAIDRCRIPVRHEYKKAFKVAMMNAFLEWDPNELQKVKATLLSHDWTEERFDSAMFYRPSFFRTKIARVALPPKQLYWRVRAVFKVFGNKVDSKSNVALFNPLAWGKAKNLLSEILKGYYSDPPGFNFYKYVLNRDGSVKKDCYGIPVLRSTRGSNHVEALHRQMNTTFRLMAGIEMGDGLLMERKQMYPGWQSVSDYVDTDESAITSPIHNTPIQEKLESRVATLKAENNFSPNLTPETKHLCERWGVPLPFLPVMREQEFKWFSGLMLRPDLKKFDSDVMSLAWMEKVDGVHVYPKLPSQLREYHKHWERNTRIKKAIEKMKPEKDLLDKYLDEQVPEDFGAMNLGDDDNGGVTENAVQNQEREMCQLEQVSSGNLPWCKGGMKTVF
ncbi:MAG: hypothetical protein SGILL_004811, partial [Bacillariaceae sp.]